MLNCHITKHTTVNLLATIVVATIKKLSNYFMLHILLLQKVIKIQRKNILNIVYNFFFSKS